MSKNVLLQQYGAVHGVDAAVLLVPGRDVEELVRVVGLQQVDGLLELVEVRAQHEAVLEAVDEVREVLHVLGQRRHAVGVDLLDVGRER